MPEQELGPRVVTSRRRVVYRRKTWDSRHWEVLGAGGVTLLKAAAIKAKDSIFLWLGAAGQPNSLEWVHLALPDQSGRAALASTLLGESTAGDACARLSAALACPVYLAGAGDLRRTLAPPLERSILQYLRTWMTQDAEKSTTDAL